MSSIGGVSSSGMKSIYGNKNIISGLASGMDTESMIENAVSGHKLKITQLNQQRTQLEWKQESYRSMIDKMVDFNQKYTSYTSSSNLLSPSFFDSAVKYVTQGGNAGKVSATGKTSSTVVLNSVSQLATATRYATSGNMKAANEAAGSFKLDGTVSSSKLNGTLTLGYGGKKVSISFSEQDVYASPEEMAKAINSKLEEESIVFDGGTQAKASDKIRAVVKDNTIAFETVTADDDNGVWIDSASAAIKDALHITLPDSSDTSAEKVKSFAFNKDDIVKETSMVDALADKGFSVTFDGKTKTIKGPSLSELGDDWATKSATEQEAIYIEKLNEKLEEAFGKDKLKVEDAAVGEEGIRLKFTTTTNLDFSVSSSMDKALGMEGGLTSYVNLNTKMGDLLPQDAWKQELRSAAVGAVKQNENGEYVDSEGNRVEKVGDGPDEKWYQVDAEGKALYDFKIGDKTVAKVTQDTSLAKLMDQVNNNENSDFKIEYSKFTKEFTITAKDTGVGHEINIAEGSLAAAMFGATTDKDQLGDRYTAGQNAMINVTVNGKTMEHTSSSNTIDIDGMNLTLKDTFKEGDPVTFSTSVDADKIVKVVKEMIDDYNAMVSEIKDAYSTLPQKDSRGKDLKPLTDEDRADMSESAVAAYEKRAKSGLLFADRDLNSLYTGLTEALNVLGVSGNDMAKIGITTGYSGGKTTLTLDETAFRAALETNLDGVKDVFTRSVNNGASSDGLMAGLQNQLNKYASTTGAFKGVLIEKAGSSRVPTSVLQNDLQRQIDQLDKEITKWETRMTDQIDYYNSKFTALEKMIMQMNNQSSMLMGLNGGY